MDKKIFLLISSLAIFTVRASDRSAKPYENWWQDCLERNVDYTTFSRWLGPIDAPSRIYMRRYVTSKRYKSLLDVPCGVCIDYFGLARENRAVKYTGLDITKKLIDRAKEQGIDAVLGSIEKIPFNDNHFDIIFARHILEHLQYYQKALDDMIRVAGKEVLVIFFRKPDEKPDRINFTRYYNTPLYDSHYNKAAIEKYVLVNKKVKGIHWEDLNDKESALHIYV